MDYNQLSSSEKKFLKKRTNLTANQVKILIEEDRDYNLVLHSLAKKGSAEEKVKIVNNFSSFFGFRYLLFKFEKTGWDVGILAKLADCVAIASEQTDTTKTLELKQNENLDLTFGLRCLGCHGFFRGELEENKDLKNRYLRLGRKTLFLVSENVLAERFEEFSNFLKDFREWVEGNL